MEEEAGTLTIFGGALLELMGKRGIRSWAALSKLLRAKNYDFQPVRISNWAYGKHAAGREFPQALKEVLALSESEATDLALAFTFGQSKRLSGEMREPLAS